MLATVQRRESCETDEQGLARGDRNWRLNDRQRPNFRGARVVLGGLGLGLGPGLGLGLGPRCEQNLLRGIKRVSRNGRMSLSPSTAVLAGGEIDGSHRPFSLRGIATHEGPPEELWNPTRIPTRPTIRSFFRIAWCSRLARAGAVTARTRGAGMTAARRRSTAKKKWRIVMLGFGTARQKRVLERWTNPKPL